MFSSFTHVVDNNLVIGIANKHLFLFKRGQILYDM